VGVVLSALVADLKASLHDAASVFTAAQDADYTRMLGVAARDLAATKRPRTLVGEFSLVADQDIYTTVPADLLLPKVGIWGSSTMRSRPWDAPNEPLPTISRAELGGVIVLVLSPAPSARQISAFGSLYRYYYLAAHVLSENANTSTIQDRDAGLLLLRAQAEAMRELAMRNYFKPVTLRGASPGVNMSRNGEPATLYQAMLREFREAA
jgi:hypothetical protein